MAEQVKLETILLGQLLASIIKLQGDVQTTRNNIAGVASGLDWEVGSKEKIEAQLSNLNKSLGKQEEALGQMKAAIEVAIEKSEGFNADLMKRIEGIIASVIAIVSTIFPSSRNQVIQNTSRVLDWFRGNAGGSGNEQPPSVANSGGNGTATISVSGIENRGKGTKVEAKLDAFFNKYKGTKFARSAAGGSGCAAFARSAWQEMYGINGFKGKSSINEVCLSDSEAIKNSISVGDVIRMESGTGGVHWFVVKSWDESGITVYQSEGIDNGKANRVLETTYPWSGGASKNSSIANFFGTESKLSKNAKFIMHHANNYDAVNG